jgi:galactokinase
VQCGLLDQITSLFGKHQHLILIDFKTLKIDPIPFPENMQFLICDPGVKHTLADSEYNSRRTECEESVQLFRRMLQRDIRSLRDISLHELADYGKHMEEIPVRRAVHVISENMRVEQAVKMLRRNEMELLGSMMFASHESSIQNFENSSPEQDMVVLAAKRLDQVLGARLTGGGFGGNVLVLVKRENAEYVGQALTRKYEELQGHPLHVRLAYPADGSRILA